MRKRIFMGLCLVILAGVGMSWAQGCFYDDAAFFSSKGVKPDVFVLLDRSGSMCWDPASTYYPCSGANSSYNYCYYGNLGACPTSPYYCIGCDAPLNGTNLYGPCSKIHLATQALFSVLDADSNGTVNDADSLALKVRLGYGHFYNSSGEYGEDVPYNNDTIGTRYSQIWNDLSQEGVCGGTPLNHAVWLSKELVRTTHIREGSAWACRKRYVIVITDGNDTYGCNGYGYYNYVEQRRSSVNVTYTAFSNDTVQVFVIGFPDVNDPNQKNVLNWMAFCGGTRNTAVPQTGDTTAFVPINYGTTYQTCAYNSTDPGADSLRGYAFLATNATQLKAALKNIFQQVSQSSGSTFSPPSVPANFTTASMLLVNNFDAKTYPTRWRGHLGAFEFYNGGGIPVFGTGGLDSSRLRWDAGTILRERNISTDPRTIYTAFKNPTGYSLYQLNDTMVSGGHIKPESLGFSSTHWDSLRTTVNYMYYDSVSGSAKFGWLGDPFHAGPIDVGYPNPYFSTDTLYPLFVSNLHYIAPRPRRVYLQANDGMVHMFKADSASLDSAHNGGRELWALVPAHVRPWLWYQLFGHDYTLDGPMVSTNILVPGLTTPSTVKWQDWRTLLVAGERTGGRNYYALDITHPDSSGYPKYLWECGPATKDNSGAANGDPAMGFTFGMATICRVKDSTGAAPYERYVAFLPGGYDCGNINRGNFILAVDAYTGKLLKRIDLGTYGAGPGVAASLRPVDLNYDGYVDRLYVGDMNGNVWRIILDDPIPQPGPGYAVWHATKFFNPSFAGYNKPIFGQVSVAADYKNTLYIMWGTGNRNQPVVADSQHTNAFFGVEDADTSVLYNMGMLNNANSYTQCLSTSLYGWYVDLYTSATNFKEVYTNAVTVSDTVRALAWTPSSSQTDCNGAGAGSDTLLSFLYTCGYNPGKVTAGTGIPPYQLGWGVDRQGNVTALLPNLKTIKMGSLNRGKFIRVWREIY